jgi:hypothetical protein
MTFCLDLLQAGRSGDRIPVGARFSAPVQTGPGAHPASYTVGTGSFPGVKRQGRGIDHPPPSSTKVKERVELHLCFPFWVFVACYRVNYDFVGKYLTGRPVRVRLTMHEVRLGLVLRPGRLVFRASIIPPMLRSYSFIHHGRYVILTI